MDARVEDIYRRISVLCQRMNYLTPIEFQQIECEIGRLEEELLILEGK